MARSDTERRRALETERHEIQTRLADWGSRLERAEWGSTGDYLYAPLGGCAVGVPLFAFLMWRLMRNVQSGAQAPNAYPMFIIFGSAAAVIVAGAIVFAMRRRMRTSRVAAVKESYATAARPLQQRLEEIDEQLRTLDTQA